MSCTSYPNPNSCHEYPGQKQTQSPEILGLQAVLEELVQDDECATTITRDLYDKVRMNVLCSTLPIDESNVDTVVCRLILFAMYLVPNSPKTFTLSDKTIRLCIATILGSRLPLQLCESVCMLFAQVCRTLEDREDMSAIAASYVAAVTPETPHPCANAMMEVANKDSPQRRLPVVIKATKAPDVSSTRSWTVLLCAVLFIVAAGAVFESLPGAAELGTAAGHLSKSWVTAEAWISWWSSLSLRGNDAQYLEQDAFFERMANTTSARVSPEFVQQFKGVRAACDVHISVDWDNEAGLVARNWVWSRQTQPWSERVKEVCNYKSITEDLISQATENEREILNIPEYLAQAPERLDICVRDAISMIIKPACHASSELTTQQVLFEATYHGKQYVDRTTKKWMQTEYYTPLFAQQLAWIVIQTARIPKIKCGQFEKTVKAQMESKWSATYPNDVSNIWTPVRARLLERAMDPFLKAIKLDDANGRISKLTDEVQELQMQITRWESEIADKKMFKAMLKPALAVSNVVAVMGIGYADGLMAAFGPTTVLRSAAIKVSCVCWMFLCACPYDDNQSVGLLMIEAATAKVKLFNAGWDAANDS